MARSCGFPYSDNGYIGQTSLNGIDVDTIQNDKMYYVEGLGNLDGFSLKKILKKVAQTVVSIPKRAIALSTTVFVTPFKIAQAVVSGGSVSTVLKKAETKLRQSGAIPGDVRKYGEKLLPYILAATGVGTAASVAIQAALAARQIVLAKKAAKQAAGQAESRYNAQLNDAYVAYTKEAQNKGVAPVPYLAFKQYVETGRLGG